MNETSLVYFRMQILQAEIEMQGMAAENQRCECDREPPTYLKQDFMALIEKYGIYHNNFWSQGS